ncbi:transposase [Salinibacter ruber]|uniref:transposase n=1 Tax=Salinibacter ruber TaxID=146919 RepID=UPI00216A9581|nr:transposase [Salinibacter ruber]
MPRTRAPYPPRFRKAIVLLVKNGKSVSELADIFEPAAATIRNWIEKAEDGTAMKRLDGHEQEELRRLKRKNEVLVEVVRLLISEAGSSGSS